MSKYLLLFVVLISFVLRIWGNSFGLPGQFRPDEEFILNDVYLLLDGRFTPTNMQHPALYKYVNALLIKAISEFVDLNGVFGAQSFKHYVISNQFAPIFLITRTLTAFLGGLCVFFLYRLAEVCFNRKVALFSSALLAVNFVHVRESHYVTTDVCISLFAILVFYFLVKEIKHLKQESNLISRLFLSKNLFYASLFFALAISTKYSAAILFFPILLCLLFSLKTRKSFNILPFLLYFFRLLAFSLFVFVLVNYKIVSNFDLFVEGAVHHLAVNSLGHIGLHVKTGFDWLFNLAIKYGIGSFLGYLLVVSIFHALYQLIKNKISKEEKEILLLISLFIFIGCIPFLKSKTVFLRYIVIFVPFFLLLISRTVVTFLEVCKLESKFLSLGVFAVVSFEPTQNLIWMDYLLTRTDTRIIAGKWIEANLKPGSRVLISNRAFYSAPFFSNNYKRDNMGFLYKEENSKIDTFAVLDNYPLTSYVTKLPESLEEKFKSEKGLKKLVEFSPYIKDLCCDESVVFDQADAFFLPVSGFERISRPGPKISIYKVETLPLKD